MRNLRLTLFVTFLAVLFVGAFAAVAQTAAPVAPPTDPGSVITGILTAFTGKKWLVLVGFLLTGVIYFLRTFVLKNVKWTQTGWGGAVVAWGIAIVGTVGMELAAGVVSWATIADAVMAALMAAGGWSLVVKRLLPDMPAPGIVIPPA
jgi:hypothetical protein